MNTSHTFFLYARKSTDEADRQVLSIEAQLFELREYAKKEGLHIAHEFIESKTAKSPGREIFNEMLARIENGEACGIVAWHPDRLARNSVDGGRIIYLIDTGHISALKFPTYWFETTPQGKFMLSIAFGQSKYYVDNLSENIKRGIRQKLRNGVWPAYTPHGYVNDRNAKCIIPDPVHAPLIRKTFELYATGEYSLAELRKVINELGLVSRRGGKLSISNFHNILKNPLYHGTIRWNGELYEGKHEPIISKKLFDECQAVLSRRSKAKKPTLKPYMYRGLFRCGECGCFITTETQKGHNYLRCTKRKKTCTQRYAREDAIASQIQAHIQKVAFTSDWTNWMIAENRKESEQSVQSAASHVKVLEDSIAGTDTKLDTLLDMAVNGTLSQEEYAAKKASLLATKTELKEKLTALSHERNNRFELTESFLKELNQAENIAAQGNLLEQRNFFKKIGSNPRLASRTLSVTLKKPFGVATKQKTAALAAADSGVYTDVYTILRREWDSNPRRTFILNSFQDCRLRPLSHLSTHYSTKKWEFRNIYKYIHSISYPFFSEYSRIAPMNSSPNFLSFWAPTPFICMKASSVCGRCVAMSRSVLSPKTMYGGTFNRRASSVRTLRSTSNNSWS
jgi:site-specific DNA recombinase